MASWDNFSSSMSCREKHFVKTLKNFMIALDKHYSSPWTLLNNVNIAVMKNCVGKSSVEKIGDRVISTHDKELHESIHFFELTLNNVICF